MIGFEDKLKLIKQLYPCDISYTEDYSSYLEDYEEDLLYQMEQNYCDDISCLPFVRYEDSGQAYFDVYILDSLENGNGQLRFSIHKDKRLNDEEEALFLSYVNNDSLKVDEKYFSRFIADAEEFIEGVSLRSYIPGAYILKHIYYAYHKSGPFELIYKAGLHSIGDNFLYFRDINFLADNLPDLFDGLSIRALKILNNYWGVRYIGSKSNRENIKTIFKMYGDYARPHMGESQLLYLMWCKDGVIEFNKSEYGFIDYLGTTEMVDYVQYLSMREEYGNIQTFPRAFANSEEMYVAIESIRELDQALKYEFHYNQEILNQLDSREERYCWLNSKYETIVPASINDIITEADYQMNCLVKFIPEYSLGLTDLIFFESKEDKTHLTMRVTNGVIEEVRGKRNRDLNETEKAFIRDYAEEKYLRIGYGSF